jgi:hypothetical protein
LAVLEAVELSQSAPTVEDLQLGHAQLFSYLIEILSEFVDLSRVLNIEANQLSNLLPLGFKSDLHIFEIIG